MKARALRASWLSAAVLCCLGAPGLGATALEHLRAAPKPSFRKGHTLPPLTRWGWVLSFDARVELARHWGYALELGEANAALARQLDDPKSVPSRLCALAASDPKQYPLFALGHRATHGKEFMASLPAETWCVDPKTGKKVWSPEAPDEVFRKAAALSVAPLEKVLAKAPIAILLNGGEDALSVYGHHGKIWGKDPRVRKARGERGWYDYVSRCKARQEGIIADAFRKACPRRLLYIYYFADGPPHRNRYAGWDVWAWDYKWMRRVTDLPSGSIYFRHFNSGWTGSDDMLTQVLNSTAQRIALNEPLSYNWLNAGWTRKKMGPKAFGELDRYEGFLACWYTAGMIGGVAGYFEYPQGGFGGDVGAEPPHWLAQMMVLARVHARFSHLEDWLRQGRLLPGPARHRWSKDLPACEFPTGDASARVVVRKHLKRPAWLATAWAAAGKDRPVTVTIPSLGRVRLVAGARGSVYRLTLRDGKPVVRGAPGQAPPAPALRRPGP